MKKFQVLLIAAALCLCLPSCHVLYPSLMFKQKEYQFFELAQKQIDQYVIQPGDELSVKVYARDGFRLIDIIGNSSSSSSSVQSGGQAGGGNAGASNGSSSALITYLVDNEGFVRYPIIGEMFVKGYTEREMQRILADRFANLFVDPFVIVHIENRRCFVFKGAVASVIALNNGPTSLLEVIARSNGLEPNSKAFKIKIIRGDIKNPQVMLVDLSTLEGMRKADLIIQSNDIIYIEEKRISPALTILNELAPYLSIASTLFTVIVLATTFGKL
jgi:polysaccharide export outer membrane protein